MNYFITGGTGSLGHAIITELLLSGIDSHNITVFSRDEQKHRAMARHLPGINYQIGDIRDYDRLVEAMEGHSTVFHCAALKHVDGGETYVGEYKKTNIDGSINVANAAKACKVFNCLLSSSDKAVFPINAYGSSKHFAESYWFAMDRQPGLTTYKVFRWGNVLGSNGSVLHIIADHLKRGKPVPVTDPNMTRFWIKIEDAARFMVHHNNLKTRQAHIPDMRAASVLRLIAAVADVMGIYNYETEVFGIRDGEKIHEYLRTEEQWRSDKYEQYDDADLVELVKGVLCES